MLLDAEPHFESDEINNDDSGHDSQEAYDQYLEHDDESEPDVEPSAYSKEEPTAQEIISYKKTEQQPTGWYEKVSSWVQGLLSSIGF